MPKFDDTYLPDGNAVGGTVLGWPTGGSITQVFGQLSVTGSRHGGMDIGAPSGTPIYAPDQGEVWEIHQASEGRQFGTYVVLKHSDGLFTAYAHMSRLANRAIGEWVNEGDVIGYVGETGVAFGAHLHWAVSTNPAFALSFDQVSDPATYITEDDDMGMLPEEKAQVDLVRNVLWRWGLPALMRPGTESLFPVGTPLFQEGEEPPADYVWPILTGDDAEKYVQIRGFAFGLGLFSHMLRHPVTNHLHQTSGHFTGPPSGTDADHHVHVDPAGNTTGVAWVQGHEAEPGDEPMLAGAEVPGTRAVIPERPGSGEEGAVE